MSESMSERQKAALEHFAEQGMPTTTPKPAATPQPAKPATPRAAARPPKGESPVAWIGLGFFIVVLGGGAVGLGTAIDADGSGFVVFGGGVISAVGWIIAMIGIIGAGVDMGLTRYFGSR